MIASGKINKTIISGFLGAAVIIAALFFGFQQAAQGSSQLPSGSGEIPISENRIAPGRVLNPSLSDLHRHERQQAAQVSDFTGFGDLRRYENQIEALRKVHAAPVGMGDLRLFESGR